MDTQQKTERLQSMMKSYEGSRHSVVALSVQDGRSNVIGSGAQIPGVSREEMIFEIGSITKVFTAILLCVLVEEGKVDPTAPLREMSDALADVPSWITPQSLTSHTSGLPNFFVPLWKALIRPLPEGPYSEFSRSDLLAWFGKWHAKAPGSKRRHAYSNLGVGLLGEAIALREGKPFVDLLTEKVIEPLGLKDTTDRLNAVQRGRFAQPRHPNGKAVAPWTFQALAAAGCLRSTASDLARFSGRVIQAVNAPKTTLDRAIFRSALPVLGLGRRGGKESTAQCSGWLAVKYGETAPRFLFHNGGTAGSTCALYICPEKAQALAVLSNNGVGGNLWGSTKLSWSNQHRQAHDFFAT